MWYFKKIFSVIEINCMNQIDNKREKPFVFKIETSKRYNNMKPKIIIYVVLCFILKEIKCLP